MREETSWLGICTGTNDNTAICNSSPDLETILEYCQEQARYLVQEAKTISEKYDLDVFLIDQPPRYPTKNADKNRAKYSKLVNSHVAALAASEEKIHLVETSNLARQEGKARSELFSTDGIHLTEKGAYTLETNVIMALHKVKPELRNLEVHTKKTSPKVPEAQYRNTSKVNKNQVRPCIRPSP